MKHWRLTFVLTGIAVVLKIITLFPGLVERYYSTGLFEIISIVQRSLTGFIPFSIGDFLYAAAIILIFLRLVKVVKALFKRRITKKSFFISLRRTVNIMLLSIVLFYGLWGLNYYREGLSAQLGLKATNYNRNDLQRLNLLLIHQLNFERKQLEQPGAIEFKRGANAAYLQAEIGYPFLKYRVASVKNSLYGTLLNYFGFLGYYNPFTGEAQVNATVPPFTLPFTTCHEIGHQLGYATEDEANFAGYLSATSDSSAAFRYSAFLELFLYSNGQLSSRDSLTAKANYFLCDSLVREDILDYKNFLLSYKNPLEPLLTAIYSKYLQVNNQPAGIYTYSDVVALLIAFEKKYGRI